MQITDPIADMLTRIRNAGTAKHETVDVPASKMKKAIVEILLNEGYIKSYQLVDDGTQGIIRITLKYLPGKEKAIQGLKRVSKPGLRMYAGAEELPRVRDFRGISADAFDGRGNYSLGIREQIIFPEIEYDKIEKLRGMNIAICTTANTDEEARELLKLMGAPFMND